MKKIQVALNAERCTVPHFGVRQRKAERKSTASETSKVDQFSVCQTSEKSLLEEKLVGQVSKNKTQNNKGSDCNAEVKEELLLSRMGSLSTRLRRKGEVAKAPLNMQLQYSSAGGI